MNVTSDERYVSEQMASSEDISTNKVYSRLDELDRTLEKLSNLLVALQNRLKPIRLEDVGLDAEGAKEAGTREAGTRENVSPVENIIRAHNDRAHLFVRIVNQLLEELRV